MRDGIAGQEAAVTTSWRKTSENVHVVVEREEGVA
jgi:hypothetical protein